MDKTPLRAPIGRLATGIATFLLLGIGPCVAPNFGLVEIDWDAQPTPVIRLAARGLTEDPGFEYRLSIADPE